MGTLPANPDIEHTKLILRMLIVTHSLECITKTTRILLSFINFDRTLVEFE